MMDRKHRIKGLSLLLAAVMLFTSATVSAAAGSSASPVNTWMLDNSGWRYFDAAGQVATNCWIADSASWCYVGNDGYCITNAWVADSLGWCYLDEEGRMATNRWVMDSVTWCYLDERGYCVTNAWVADSVGMCYLGADGRMVTNQWVDGFYVDEDGYRQVYSASYQLKGARSEVPSLPDEPIFIGAPDTENPLLSVANRPVSNAQAAIEATDASVEACTRGDAFAEAIQNNRITGFEKPGDQMVHVSTFTQVGGYYYMTYYANTSTGAEDPTYQMARLAYCPADDVDNKVYLDLQKAGDKVGDKTVRGVYDTVMMQKDERTLYLMWTANLDGVYYRLYRLFDTVTETLGEVRVNRLEVCGERADFSVLGMSKLFAKYGIPCRTTFSDIGLMQKITSRVEGGETYYYTGAYCGNMTFIVKSKDFFTWEYVSQPDFNAYTKWENAVYVVGDRAYYFVRQEEVKNGGSPYGILTYYDLAEDTWAAPVLVADCQSRSDFIMHDGELYLFYAPISRQHIGVLHIDQENIADSKIVMQAYMKESCFYPFVQYCDGELYFSYTMNRKKIQFSRFDAATFLSPAESLEYIDGVWKYLRYGEEAPTAETMYRKNGRLYYVKDGVADHTLDATVEYDGARYIVRNGLATMIGTLPPALPTLPDEPVYLRVPNTDKELILTPNKQVTDAQAVIEASDASDAAKSRGQAFAEAIQNNWITGFEKPGDQMVHVSTFTQVGGYYYMTYYANTSTGAEDPTYQMARLAYCPVDDVDNKVYLDLQKAGDKVGDKTVRGVYDTVMMQKDERTLYLMWTANLDGIYYRLYRLFDTVTETLGEVRVNRLEVCGERADFSVLGMSKLFAKYGIPCRTTFTDIGLMQKITSRVEGGETYYYTGAYCGNMTFIVKSKDFFTWEYVAQPPFDCSTQWENAVYIIGNRAYYFVRQVNSDYGILTYYDLVYKKWAAPVLVADCQSRSDFIMHDGELYLIHTPINRNHIGIVHVDQKNLADSNIILQAQMHESCFYPFVQYCDGELYFSYTMNRKKIQFSRFDADIFLTPTV